MRKYTVTFSTSADRAEFVGEMSSRLSRMRGIVVDDDGSVVGVALDDVEEHWITKLIQECGGQVLWEEGA